MEMCYDGALVMPSSYAVMDEEEMQYTTGGVSIPNWLAAGAIDLAISAVVGGGLAAAAGFFKKQAAKYGTRAAGLIFSKQLKKKLVAKGISCAAASKVCSLASACFTVLMWAVSPGAQLASAIDARDKKPRNGRIDI